jgi:TonB family protein
MRPDGPIAEFEIDPEPIWPADDARLEPLFFAAPLWLEFDEPGMDGPLLPDWPLQEPLLVAFDPDAPLVAEPVERDAPVSARADSRTERLGSWLGSLGVHLLPALLLVAIAPRSAGAPGSAIPVRLLVMQAPISEPNQSTPQLAASALPPPQSAPQPLPTPHLPPPPRPQRHASIAPLQPQKPSPRQEAPAEHHAAEPAKATSPHQATDAVTQPAAMTRDQYLAYLVNLTWRHVDMLPASFIAGRKGETRLLIRVMSDGTIASIVVAQSSGYPEIDTRIEQIVTAIGRYPPLPSTFSGPSAELDMVLRFPQVLKERH